MHRELDQAGCLVLRLNPGPFRHRDVAVCSMSFGIFRTSPKRHTSRPPASNASARKAWDAHLKNGPIVWMQLLDGYWGAARQNGDIDEIANTFEFNKRKKSQS